MLKISTISCCDDNYVRYFGVMLCSLFENKNPDVQFDVHLIEDGITEKSRQQLKVIEDRYGFNIHYIPVKKEQFEGFRVSGHISLATYYRICVPDLLPKTINKVLYIDCDMVIRKDLTELWNTDFQGNWAAVVEDLGALEEDKVRIGLMSSQPYFNAGLLLINLKAWRTENVHGHVLKYIRTYPEKIKYCDQDGLNAVMKDHVMFLSLEYNATDNLTPLVVANSTKQQRKSRIDATIAHYTPEKPDQYRCTHQNRYDYFSYLQKTPWRKGIGAIIKIVVGQFCYVLLFTYPSIEKFLYRIRGSLPHRILTRIWKGIMA